MFPNFFPESRRNIETHFCKVAYQNLTLVQRKFRPVSLVNKDTEILKEPLG